MNTVEIQIFDAYGHQLKCYTPQTESDLCFHHEMFNGTRYFDLTAQLAELLDQGLNENNQSYSLFCTYVKFGATHQEQADFNVIIRRKRNQK